MDIGKAPPIQEAPASRFKNSPLNYRHPITLVRHPTTLIRHPSESWDYERAGKHHPFKSSPETLNSNGNVLSFGPTTRLTFSTLAPLIA